LYHILGVVWNHSLNRVKVCNAKSSKDLLGLSPVAITIQYVSWVAFLVPGRFVTISLQST
jgi:hypothetical protein